MQKSFSSYSMLQFSFLMLLSIYCSYAWNRQMNVNFNSGTLTVITGANSICFTPTLSQPSWQWLISFPLEML